MSQPEESTRSATSAAASITGPYPGPESTTAADAPARQAAGMPDVPGYAIESVLGRGGMGVVYKAQHLALKRTVALKMILAGGHAGEQARARFRAEAEAVARLQHPCIVQVYEIGEIDGLPFYALEYVAGGSLAERIGGHPLPIRNAAVLVEKLALAMHAAHTRQVIHRDLKPANVLLTPEGEPKVSDFGLAKQLDAESQTHTGDVLGTPSYMAPEQARGTRDVGPWSDIYALGAILYHLLTGRPPFQGGTAVAVLEQVRNQEPAAPRRVNQAVPADLETICLKCLEKVPAQRYATAAALAEDLRRFREGEAILARPAGRIERLVKWARRRPTQAAAIALAVLALLLGGLGAGAAWLWQRSEIQRASAEEARDQLSEANREVDSRRKEAEQRGYFDSVRLAHREALDMHDGARAFQFLDECPKHLREWEWHHVRNLCQSGDRILHGHRSPPDRLCFSPDGRRLASASYEDGVLIWDLSGGKIERTLPETAKTFARMAFTGDGRLVTIGSRGALKERETTLRVWDPAGKELVTRSLGSVFVMDFAVTPDGKRLASYGDEKSVRLWNMDTGQVEQTLPVGYQVWGIGLSADGRQLAASLYYGPGVRLWDLEKGGPARTLPGVRTTQLGTVAFSSDGGYLAGLGSDYSIWGWDLAQSGSPPEELAPRSRSGCLRLAFRPGTRDLIFARGRQVVQRNGNGAERFFEGHTRLVESVAVSADGKLAASGGADRAVRLWNLTAPWRSPGNIRRLFGMGLEVGKAPVIIDPFNSVERAFHRRDGAQFAVAGLPGDGKNANVWLCDREGKVLHRHRIPVGRPTCGIVFRPDLARLAVIEASNRIRFRDAATGQPVAPELSDPGHRVNALTFSADGRLLAGHGEGKVTIWDAATGRAAHTFDTGPLPIHGTQGFEDRLIFSPDEKTVAYTAANVVVVRAVESAEVLHRLEGHAGEVHELSFSSEGRLLATGSADRTIRLWDAQSGAMLRQMRGHVEGVFDLAFSDSSRRLASGGADGSLRVWDVGTGLEALPVTTSAARFAPRSLNFDATGRLSWLLSQNLEAIDP